MRKLFKLLTRGFKPSTEQAEVLATIKYPCC